MNWAKIGLTVILGVIGLAGFMASATKSRTLDPERDRQVSVIAAYGTCLIGWCIWVIWGLVA